MQAWQMATARGPELANPTTDAPLPLVQQQVNDLGVRVGNLHDQINRLGERLGSVLRPEEAKPARDLQPQSPLCPLGQTLREYNAGLEEAETKLRTLIDLLEI